MQMITVAARIMQQLLLLVPFWDIIMAVGSGAQDRLSKYILCWFYERWIVGGIIH